MLALLGGVDLGVGDNHSKVQLVGWANQIGVDRRGTKEQIAARLQQAVHAAGAQAAAAVAANAGHANFAPQPPAPQPLALAPQPPQQPLPALNG